MIAQEVRVVGRVQGVGFRWQARRRALELGLTGWVRNDPDGSVSAHVEGSEAAVDAMVSWLGEGPPAARVDRLDVVAVPPGGLSGFNIIV